MTNLREATRHDRKGIHAALTLAFAGPEVHSVPQLACELLDETGPRPMLTLVAEVEEKIIGHVAFSPVTFSGECSLNGYLLAPLGVTPEFQKQGIGTGLVRKGIERLRSGGGDVVIVYGDPAYYGRFGFDAKTAELFHPPYTLQYPFGWQAVTLGSKGLPGQVVQVTCVRSLCDATLW